MIIDPPSQWIVSACEHCSRLIEHYEDEGCPICGSRTLLNPDDWTGLEPKEEQ